MLYSSTHSGLYIRSILKGGNYFMSSETTYIHVLYGIFLSDESIYWKLCFVLFLFFVLNDYSDIFMANLSLM